jgi:GDPmannose 4,6-dehydratase
MFGSNYVESADLGKYQNEATPFVPQSPYAISKLASHHMVRVYRDAYGLYACAGILFNHESPRRGENFVTRKITKYIGNVANKRIDGSVVKLKLGNLDATRDWGHAKDYVYGMYLMLQQDKPKDYVLATGESHTVKEFLELAFNSVDLDYRDYVVVDPEFYRPCEVPFLRGDSTLARRELGWENKVSFQQLVSEMVQNDVA